MPERRLVLSRVPRGSMPGRDEAVAVVVPEPAAPTETAPPKESPAEAMAVVVAEPPVPSFYATGRPRQTSVGFDEDCDSRLYELAHGAGVSVNALAVAALHSGIEIVGDNTCAAIREERVRRVRTRSRRIERNLRLPQRLRTGIDELMAGFATSSHERPGRI